jgi:hypothetical protein
MVFAGIQERLLSEFPELRERLQKAFGSYYNLKEETPGAYPVFESVLKPVVLESLVKPASDPLILRIFAFFEAMAVSEDVEVVNLLWIAILVPLAFDRERIRHAWRIMGPGTRKVAREVAERNGWKNNLPP